MINELPTIEYSGRLWVVDFRLSQMRDSKTAEFVKFTDIKDSKLKETLRGIRFRHYSQIYMPGLDDK